MGKDVLGPNSCQKYKSFLDGGGGATPEILVAYRGELVLLHLPEAKRQVLNGYWPNLEA
jgi:hypothetical protein